MCVTITPSALHFMRRILRLSGHPEHGFRLLVTPGGCSGMSVDFSVESAPWAGDVMMGHDGVKIFMPAATNDLLARCTVDFNDTRHSSGLIVKDPKSDACGCAGAGSATVDISRLKRQSEGISK
ncbi:MAG: HesB/IscA family protein [Acidiferrobacter sp.]